MPQLPWLMGYSVKRFRGSEMPRTGSQWLSCFSDTPEVLIVQSKLRNPIKILMGTSSEVDICRFLLVTFARLGLSLVSFSESVPPTSATAKQLPALIPDTGVYHPSSVSLCFCPLCYLLTLSLCLCLVWKGTRSGDSVWPLAWSASGQSFLCQAPVCTAQLPGNGVPVLLLLVDNCGRGQHSQSQVWESYFIILYRISKGRFGSLDL